MQSFVHAHASHADWRSALALVLAQLDSQVLDEPTLGWCYFTDHHAQSAEALLAGLRERYPGVAWVGAVGVGICAGNVEYFDEPALAVMLASLPREQFRVFSGRRPLAAAGGAGFAASTALVHADPATPDLAELIAELSERVGSGYLFGGLGSARNRTVLVAADGGPPGEGDSGVFEGGLSGVAFGAQIGLISRVTQGCQPVGAARLITEAERNVVYALDGEPALDCLLRDLGVDEHAPRDALPRLRSTLVGLSDGPVAEAGAGAGAHAVFGVGADADHAQRPWSYAAARRGESPGDRTGAPAGAALPPGSSAFAQNPEFSSPPRRGAFGTETRVRHLIGLDPQRRGVAIGDIAEPGQRLAFCRRDVEAARRDLVRVAAEIRSALEPEDLPLAGTAPGDESRRIVGAVYVSCTGRGGLHFGAPSAELQLLQHALTGAAQPAVPLVGFFAAGEIGHRQLYGYTGVLTVFTAPA
jgi:small ligand-binding sensory domain FIST